MISAFVEASGTGEALVRLAIADAETTNREGGRATETANTQAELYQQFFEQLGHEIMRRSELQVPENEPVPADTDAGTDDEPLSESAMAPRANSPL